MNTEQEIETKARVYLCNIRDNDIMCMCYDFSDTKGTLDNPFVDLDNPFYNMYVCNVCEPGPKKQIWTAEERKRIQRISSRDELEYWKAEFRARSEAEALTHVESKKHKKRAAKTKIIEKTVDKCLPLCWAREHQHIFIIIG